MGAFVFWRTAGKNEIGKKKQGTMSEDFLD
jgi:hypothetical protein